MYAELLLGTTMTLNLHPLEKDSVVVANYYKLTITLNPHFRLWFIILIYACCVKQTCINDNSRGGTGKKAKKTEITRTLSELQILGLRGYENEIK